MTASLFLITLWLLLLVAVAEKPSSLYPVDEYFFDAVVDHYNFRPTQNATFALRFFVNQQHWNGTGPCFFYAGNEADILFFVNNSGFLFEAAQEFGAMVVFAEHRYYGKSQIPFDISYLTVEQAMADFNTLNLHLRRTWKMSRNMAFIVFGGSYGANLALWLRLKNPNLWAGAIASSATPLKHVLRETNRFAQIETEVYANVSLQCPELVRAGWKELYDGATTRQGRAAVSKHLGLCLPLPSVGAADNVHGFISNALETMVQYGYPYSSHVYNPVPAYPFRVACHDMLSAGTGLGALRAAANVFYNHTGQAGPCFDFGLVAEEAAKHWIRKGDRNRVGLHERRMKRQRVQGDESSWGYQTCTEVYQPMPTDGKSDFEVPYMPNRTAYFEDCWRRYGVHPRPEWEEMNFMGADIGTGSNIFLTNGQLDPWRAAGIQQTFEGGSILVRTVENGAHHLDLRAASCNDPPSVVAVRHEQKAAIHKWIQEWKREHPTTKAEDQSSKGQSRATEAINI